MAAQLFLLQTLNKPVTVLENSLDVCGHDRKEAGHCVREISLTI